MGAWGNRPLAHGRRPEAAADLSRERRRRFTGIGSSDEGFPFPQQIRRAFPLAGLGPARREHVQRHGAAQVAGRLQPVQDHTPFAPQTQGRQAQQPGPVCQGVELVHRMPGRCTHWPPGRSRRRISRRQADRSPAQNAGSNAVMTWNISAGNGRAGNAPRQMRILPRATSWRLRTVAADTAAAVAATP